MLTIVSSAEFLPYVFQILSQLLELHKKDSLGPFYQAILPSLTNSVLWEVQANVPPLVRLLCAYLTKGTQLILSHTKLEEILGIFQKLVISMATDVDGFVILDTIIVTLPP